MQGGTIGGHNYSISVRLEKKKKRIIMNGLLTLFLMHRIQVCDRLDRLAHKSDNILLFWPSDQFLEPEVKHVLEDPTADSNAHDGSQIPPETKSCGSNCLFILITYGQDGNGDRWEGKSLSTT